MDKVIPMGAWKELESDPGLFTLLIRDFGVKGVQVEEVYDLQRPLTGRVYGFIFLFKWSEVGRCRRKAQMGQDEPFCTDEETVNSMFFAHQLIPNSCATHALLSVLLNCEGVELGDIIQRLKDTCQLFDPETKGFAIANMPELYCIHNRHANPETNPLSERLRDKPNGITPSARTVEAFHYTCYLPMNDHLFELDGLKPYPIDHGPVSSTCTWHDMSRQVINQRISAATGGEQCHDIRYNLMAVVPSRIDIFEANLKSLLRNHKILSDAIENTLSNLCMDENESKELQDILHDTRENVQECISQDEGNKANPTALAIPDKFESADGKPRASDCKILQDIQMLIKEWKMQSDMSIIGPDESDGEKSAEIQSIRDVQRVLLKLETNVKHCKLSLQEEHDKVKKYEIDAARRTHNYDPFIRMFLAMLAERGLLANLVDDNLIVKQRKVCTTNSKSHKAVKKPDRKKRRKK